MEFHTHANELLNLFRAQLISEKEKGSREVTIDELIRWSQEQERQINAGEHLTADQQWDATKMSYDARMRRDEALQRMDENLFDSLVAATLSATKTLFTMNGAASISMLAFIGHLASIGHSSVPLFGWPLVAFSAGTASIGLMTGVIYFAQDNFSAKREGWGSFCKAVSILLGAISILAFCGGVYLAFDLFGRLAPSPKS